LWPVFVLWPCGRSLTEPRAPDRRSPFFCSFVVGVSRPSVEVGAGSQTRAQRWLRCGRSLTEPRASDRRSPFFCSFVVGVRRPSVEVGAGSQTRAQQGAQRGFCLLAVACPSRKTAGTRIADALPFAWGCTGRNSLGFLPQIFSNLCQILSNPVCNSVRLTNCRDVKCWSPKHVQA
jgi:hypothetical protein